MMDMVQGCDDSPLERLEIWTKFRDVQSNRYNGFTKINEVLREKKQSKDLRQSLYRHALLPMVLHGKSAARHDFAFAILKQNADLIRCINHDHY